MDNFSFLVPFNSILAISGQWTVDNERLYAMEPRLRLRRFRLERGSNTGASDQNRLRPDCADVMIAVSFS